MKITKQRLKEIIKEELQALTEVDRGEWVIEREGVSWDEKFLNRGLKWGTLERAEVHEFKQEAAGVLRYALESGKIDSGNISDKRELEGGGEEALHLKAPSSQGEIDRLAYGARTGRWRK
tara:strand:+ start:626 stop:985 length:360 start_codon:yes stop_codon:yes gene_type:complete